MQRRTGLATWQILLIIAAVIIPILLIIIGVLAALLLPAIQAARQAAIKNACRGRMKQQALVIQIYIDTFKRLPPLYKLENQPELQEDPRFAQGSYPWTVQLLPFMNDDAIYKEISAKSNRFTKPAEQVIILAPDGKQCSPAQLTFEHWICQAYPGERVNSKGEGISNYAAVSATRQQLLTVGKDQATLADGVIIPQRLRAAKPGEKKPKNFLTLGDISDGTSKTIVLAETQEPEFSSWYHWQQNQVCGFVPGETSLQNPMINQQGQWQAQGPAASRTALNVGPQYYVSPDGQLNRDWGPSSSHMGGIVIHAMADGSVQEISDVQIDPAVYFSLITRSGGENVIVP